MVAERPLATLDDVLDVLIEIRDLLGQAQEQVQRYCLPLIEDGVVICPGGIPVGPSFYEGKRTLDKWQHLLPEDKHGPAVNKRGTAYERRYHSPYTSETSLDPMTSTTPEGAVEVHEDAAHAAAVDRLAEEQADAAAASEALTSAQFVERVRGRWPDVAAARVWQALEVPNLELAIKKYGSVRRAGEVLAAKWGTG